MIVAVSVVARPSTSISVTTRPSLALSDIADIANPWLGAPALVPCPGSAPLSTAPPASPATSASGAPISATRRRLRVDRRRGRAVGGRAGGRVALGTRGFPGMPADPTDLPVEHDAELGLHPAAHFFAQPLDVGG